MSQGGEWEWSLAEEALEAAGMCPTKEYIWRWKATIGYYIANKPIHDTSSGMERLQVSIRFLWCWDQDFTRQDQGNGVSKSAETELG